jgi:hypothetical protein
VCVLLAPSGCCVVLRCNSCRQAHAPPLVCIGAHLVVSLRISRPGAAARTGRACKCCGERPTRIFRCAAPGQEWGCQHSPSAALASPFISLA